MLLTYSELLQLKRWNTPTIYNGWEAITEQDRSRGWFNREETHDFMPQMGSMIGYAMTVAIEPGNPHHAGNSSAKWAEYRRYISTGAFPKIVVVQDMDKPEVIGSFWGEVNANVHRALGCVGTITDGGVRDLDEMTNAGFKALARRTCVGHAYCTPIHWGCEVEVFGCSIKPGQLIHADKHGFLVIPEQDQKRLYEAACFMDVNECNTMIAAARNCSGKTNQQVLAELDEAAMHFGKATMEKFGQKGEWI